MESCEVGSDWVSRFRRSVRRWYSRHGRQLPWVGQRDPYAVWVREIMLQQTTVTAVVGHLDRFLSRFPTVETLASATTDEVLREWEGLGYYSRARNLWKAAGVVVDEWGGAWPQSPEELEALPGVGRYTAGAIASFAFEQAAPIVEANTARLFARLIALPVVPSSSAGQKRLWSLAERVVPRVRPDELNQALIDLGATVCGVEARCEVCPVRSCCEAFGRDVVDRVPLRVPRAVPSDVFEVMVVMRRKREVFVIRHAEGGRWGGLWGFPSWERSRPVSCTTGEMVRIQRDVADGGCDVNFLEWQDAFQHPVTRFRLHLQPVEMLWHSGEWLGTERGEWVTLDDLETRPLAVAGRRIARRIASTAGGGVG